MHHKDYKGMRWYKCDLQMQTPADAQHWEGEHLAADGTNTTKLAEDYARACYESGLDVIAITDHNFLSKDFIPEIRSALDKLEAEYKRHIVLFPGFECEADVGKGIHVLCLFEPDTDLATVDHTLTACGVDYPRVRNGVLEKSTKRLPDILQIVQKAQTGDKWDGIVIIPHVFESSLFDNDRISDWLQQEEYRNSNLLAVEVPKPVHRMSQNFQKLFRSGDDCWDEWKRERPLATIMSSDNKMLRSADVTGRPVANSIGYRYTWIKMSEPSIESLRQAFLDYDSRIVVPDDVVSDINPFEREKHARIISVSISNAEFLQDQEIPLSPNLNCIIGGRGTGKSTILEGIRIALGKDKDKHHRIDDQTKEKVERIQTLLGRKNGTELRIHWRTADGVEDIIVYRVGENGIGSLSVDGRQMADLDTFLANLPIQIFSQQQLNEITRRTDNMLLLLIDDFIRDELQELKQDEETLRNEINRLFQVQRQLEQTDADIRRLTQEITELERQIVALKELREDFDRYQQLKAMGEYIDNVRNFIDLNKEPLSSLNKKAIQIGTSHTPPNASEGAWPEADWFNQRDGEFLNSKQALQTTIIEAIKQFNQTVEESYFQDEKWSELNTLIDNADSEFERACEEKDVSPEDIERIQALSEKLRRKKSELEGKITLQETLTLDVSHLPELFASLHRNWQSVYSKRKLIADEIEQRPDSYIDLQVEFGADEASFLRIWNEIISERDGRYKISRNWEEIGKCVFNVFSEIFRAGEPDANIFLSPWELFESYLADEIVFAKELEDLLDRLVISFDEIRDLLREELRSAWETTRITRVEDIVDLILYRSIGGQVAGSISDGSLSDGQRNTAALLMILAKGETPLIFDQPEDELDSSFIFRELVPMLRQMKTKRQIILVTHNANLPVNADAELVYALETKNNLGVPLAHGGLDQTKVTQAVLEIMEGSAIAFKRRREKYHF